MQVDRAIRRITVFRTGYATNDLERLQVGCGPA
jgi:hypothetical protein